MVQDSFGTLFIYSTILLSLCSKEQSIVAAPSSNKKKPDAAVHGEASCHVRPQSSILLPERQ